MSAKLRNLLFLFPILACHPTTADRFAIEAMAQKYADELQMKAHSCDIKYSMFFSMCYGLLDKGLVVRYTCSLSKTECEFFDR